MKWQRWTIVGIGITSLLMSCGDSPDTRQAQPPKPTQIAQVPAQAQKAQPFSDPVVSPTAVVEVPAVPGLIRPTSARARIPGIAAGREDPFAAIATSPMPVTINRTTRTAPQSPQSSLIPNRLPPLNLVPLPAAPSPLTPLPSISLPVERPAPVSPTALADEVVVTGAVQVGGKWNVIVQEPNAPTSRYVRVGDSLANGQVVVKRVIAGSGDPIVVLQQNGREVMKSVGGARVASNQG